MTNPFTRKPCWAALLASGLLPLGLQAEGVIDPLEYVDPFIGTGGHGHTFPGATVPNGMVQLSPDTRLLGWDACAGYHYSDTSILGFSHTHMSGTGIGDKGDVLFMPFVGKGQRVAGKADNPDSGYRSRFSHEREEASPGYYRVWLEDYQIDAELTASPRAGFHRYTFEDASEAGLVIDLAHTIHGHQNPVTELRAISDTEIEGYKRTRGWARNHHVYFHAKFDQPFTVQLFENGQEFTGKWAIASGNVQAILRFETEGEKQVQAKVGISSVDYKGARQNLESEITDWDFDRVRQEAEAAWSEKLHAIQVQGGSEDEKTIFYTALYHTALAPYLFVDVDGRYRGMDQRIHETEDQVYTVFSLWDTFRTFHPLLNIIDPEYNNDLVRTLLHQYDQGGILPKWELDANYTGTMIGSHAVSVIAEAYMKGVRDFDVEKAYEAMKKSIHFREDNDFLYPNEIVREKLNPIGKYYNDTKGYIPSDKDVESVAKALEYAYNDWCMVHMAKALGKTEDVALYQERAKRYATYFDQETGFMRGKMEDGSWREPFDPKKSQHRADDYCEGNAWQWTWFVPHDVPGLVDLFGGVQPFTEKLDELFTTSSEQVGEEVSADISGLIGQYAHGNEPSHHITHIYNYVGQSWKTQKLVDQILDTLYFNDPNGLSGNEDCGQMSAWYIMNAMGFYSFSPVDPVYSIGRPIFDEVVIPMTNGKEFTVRTVNNSPENLYIQEATLNGEKLEKPFFTHADLKAGATLEFLMGSEPNANCFK
ncbi:MAG: GH92 family glycosyl hydrolase [Verrucomicrobiota bacterium]